MYLSKKNQGIMASKNATPWAMNQPTHWTQPDGIEGSINAAVSQAASQRGFFFR